MEQEQFGTKMWFQKCSSKLTSRPAKSTIKAHHGTDPSFPPVTDPKRSLVRARATDPSPLPLVFGLKGKERKGWAIPTDKRLMCQTF